MNNLNVVRRKLSDGTITRKLNGKYHYIKGPAIIWPNKKKFYYLLGHQYTKKAYWTELFRLGIISEKEHFLKML